MNKETVEQAKKRAEQSARVRRRLKPYALRGLFRVSAYCEFCGGGGQGCEKCRTSGGAA